MKMIIAYIRPERFDRVKEALVEKGFFAMSVTEIRGRGAQKGITLHGGKVSIDLLPKLKLEIGVEDTFAESVVHIIREAAWTGKVGDGRIFVMPVDFSVRVRDEETTTA